MASNSRWRLGAQRSVSKASDGTSACFRTARRRHREARHRRAVASRRSPGHCRVDFGQIRGGTDDAAANPKDVQLVPASVDLPQWHCAPKSRHAQSATGDAELNQKIVYDGSVYRRPCARVGPLLRANRANRWWRRRVGPSRSRKRQSGCPITLQPSASERFVVVHGGSDAKPTDRRRCAV